MAFDGRCGIPSSARIGHRCVGRFASGCKFCGGHNGWRLVLVALFGQGALVDGRQQADAFTVETVPGDRVVLEAASVADPPSLQARRARRPIEVDVAFGLVEVGDVVRRFVLEAAS